MVGGELVGQYVGLSGIAGGETFFQGNLTLAAEISVGGVKVVEPVFQKVSTIFLVSS